MFNLFQTFFISVIILLDKIDTYPTSFYYTPHLFFPDNKKVIAALELFFCLKPLINEIKKSNKQKLNLTLSILI